MTALRQRLHALLGAPVTALRPLHGGRNSRVHLATLADGRRLVAKQYFLSPQDPRDRLGVEFAALEFLGRHLPGRAPAPLARDGRDLGVYEFVDGVPPGRVPSPADAEAMAEFLERLLPLSSLGREAGLPDASDACFSFEQTLESLRRRLARLARLASRTPDTPPLATPVDQRDMLPMARLGVLLEALAPALDQATAEGLAILEAAGVPPGEPLPPSLRVPSPSDFGLHNAVRVAGGLRFLDFEYFGFDDPAKMAADLLLHPGMDLSPRDATLLPRRLQAALPDDPGFTPRLRAVFPLHGLKWCCILCNECMAVDGDRRAFAGHGGPRLERAFAMLRALGRRQGLWRPPLDLDA